MPRFGRLAVRVGSAAVWPGRDLVSLTGRTTIVFVGTSEVPSETTKRGIRRRTTDPHGNQYLLQAARSGFVEWSYLTAQGLISWAVHTSATWLVNRLVFRGGWTVVAWQGDDLAPKRRTVLKRRYRTQHAATAALDELAATIARSGPQSPPLTTKF